MVLRGEIVNSIAVAGILAANTVGDRDCRPVGAQWVDGRRRSEPERH